MKKNIFFSCLLLLSATLFAQQSNDFLFSIDGTPVSITSFKKVYEKNANPDAKKSTKELKEYFDLYVNFKLKVKEAYQLKLDTLPTITRELKSFQNQLAEQFTKDEEFGEKLLEEAYQRSKYLIKASHILIKVPASASPTDTIVAYQEILKARNEIVKGADFATVAKGYSQDPTVAENNGSLGYFTVFKMVYPFETVAYQLTKGQVSMPFRTGYGYHILKVEDVKMSKGEREVAQILISDTSNSGKQKIDSLYTLLSNGANFTNLAKEFSNDTGSATSGGKLPRFGYGKMISEIEEVAFSIPSELQFSKPFKTRYGWHILQLIKKYPPQSFEEAKPILQRKINASGRAKLSNKALLARLKKKYSIKVFDKAKLVFNKTSIRSIPNDSLQGLLIEINERKIYQEDFKYYIYSRRQTPLAQLFDAFFEESILQYYKDQLFKTNKKFVESFEEYKEGILLFELMNTKVWSKAANDSVGLKAFFDTNKNKYTFKELSEDKTTVLNDYQKHLDKQLIEKLRAKFSVVISDESYKSLLEFYQEK
ncbi:peptidylprolyl isomerase [Polaribacter pacificus]|uniref:peptidylprolyl isomerase n=1 Tax=Polaribacter pacificus TaxID=1775173 RepID=UPI00166679DE|nr:peptidylprolyl isomerase [Polaribacter pacificus]